MAGRCAAPSRYFGVTLTNGQQLTPRAIITIEVVQHYATISFMALLAPGIREIELSDSTGEIPAFRVPLQVQSPPTHYI